MATYIMLFGLTEQGIRNVKESPARVETAKKTFQAMDVEVKEFYAVMGMAPYDTMFILEAPDNATVAKAALSIGSLDNVRTETLPAFTEDEYKKIIAGLR